MAIHGTLIHNPEAGFNQSSKEELLDALQRKGIEVNYVNINEDNLSLVLKNLGELVIIAGGDGTLIRMAQHLVGKNIPIGLIPMGTANNIATCLGCSGKAADIISAWNLSSLKPYSLGLVEGPEDKSFFLESVGFGLFPRLIRQRLGDKSNKKNREEELQDALQHQLKILNEYKPHFCSIILDGKQFQSNYLMVEIMNIQLSGPNMNLAPHAYPDDSYLDVVLVREDEREWLLKYLSNRSKGNTSEYKLQVKRAREIHVEWHGNHYHQDDQAYEHESPIIMDIQVMPKGLSFLSV